MFNKKAFEIQFNWIFVLVAGALILLFFATVINRQRNVSETSTKATVLKSIDAIITGSGVSSDTTSIIGIPDSNIEISCNRISIGGVSKQYQNLILFAPGSVQGDKLVAQTLSFEAPFKAANLMYLTSTKVRYIIIGNNQLANEINRLLPSDVRKDIVASSSSIRNENNYKVRFIVFDNSDLTGIDLTKFPNSDVTALKVTGTLEKGNIEFYKKNRNSWSPKEDSVYLGKASLLGAVYSDSLDVYKCNMKNTFSKLNLVTKVYHGRTTLLPTRLAEQQSTVSRQTSCDYANALQYFANIESRASASAESANFDMGTITPIKDSSASLATENSNLQRLSCPLIY